MNHAIRAIRRKFDVMRGLGSVWPAARRGGQLLIRGRFREFHRKLFNEMPIPESGSTRTGPRLFLAGHVMGHGGYDHVVRAVLHRLLAAGVNVYRDPAATFRPEFVAPAEQPSDAIRKGEARLIILPPHLLHRIKPDARSAVLTMWETDTLPADAVKLLNAAGLVIVPSEWGAACFRANGVVAPIEVIPLGHDPLVFHTHLSYAPAEHDSLCVLGTAGALDEGGIRKNVQRVIENFRKAFPTDINVCLRVKITPASPDVQTHHDPRIEVIRKSLPEAELAAWYRSLTAYVNGSFGEGFGLHLLEAMACGRPLLSTAFGGATAFFDATVGYTIAHRLIAAERGPYRGRWADPSDEAMIQAFRHIARNRAEAQLLGHTAAQRAAQFTWDQTIHQLLDVLNRYSFLSPSWNETTSPHGP